MKRIFILPAVLLVLAACGDGVKTKKGSDEKKSGKELAEEVCACFQKANSLPVSDTTRTKAQSDCSIMNQNAWNRVKDDTEKAAEFNSTIGVCGQEQIKKSLGR